MNPESHDQIDRRAPHRATFALTRLLTRFAASAQRIRAAPQPVGGHKILAAPASSKELHPWEAPAASLLILLHASAFAGNFLASHGWPIPAAAAGGLILFLFGYHLFTFAVSAAASALRLRLSAKIYGRLFLLLMTAAALWTAASSGALAFFGWSWILILMLNGSSWIILRAVSLDQNSAAWR